MKVQARLSLLSQPDLYAVLLYILENYLLEIQIRYDNRRQTLD